MSADLPVVRHFRQTLIWPLYLLRDRDADPAMPLWRLFEETARGTPWQRVAHGFGTPEGALEERHYKELVVFLPHVQRFLYGEGRGAASHAPGDVPGDSARKIFRRDDVAALRAVLRVGQPPVEVAVRRVELCFFDDVDVAFLNVEVSADELPLPVALDLLYRFGRAYPTGWNEKNGQGVHNAWKAEWLGRRGETLAVSDAGDRTHYLDFAQAHRAPPVSAHWDFLLRPMVLDASDAAGALRYRLIEYHRMPLMAFLAVDDPRALPREAWVRFGLVATVHPDEPLPAHDPDIAAFEPRYCYDRYWTDTAAGPNTRFLCSGRALIVVGDAQEDYFRDDNRGMLAQFRHQYFILFLINHFHHAALLVFSDQLVDAIHDLDIRDPASVRRFRERIRACFETFLRFTHRYWFHELSERPHMQALNRLCAGHLRNEELYAEVKEELRDMSQYLDSEAARRTNRLFMRLNVVTVFSMIGTVATGFLGMNVFALAEHSDAARFGYFLASLAGVALVLALTVGFSRQLSELMDLLANDYLPLGERLRTLFRRRPMRDDD